MCGQWVRCAIMCCAMCPKTKAGTLIQLCYSFNWVGRKRESLLLFISHMNFFLSFFLPKVMRCSGLEKDKNRETEMKGTRSVVDICRLQRDNACVAESRRRGGPQKHLWDLLHLGRCCYAVSRDCKGLLLRDEMAPRCMFTIPSKTPDRKEKKSPSWTSVSDLCATNGVLWSPTVIERHMKEHSDYQGLPFFISSTIVDDSDISSLCRCCRYLL